MPKSLTTKVISGLLRLVFPGPLSGSDFSPAIFRGDWYNFLVMLFIDADYYLVSVVFGWQWMFALPFPAIFFGFVYNYLYFRHLFHKGYRPADQHSQEVLTRAKYWK